MSSGIEDLKGFDKKSRFSYGFDFKKAVSPFFEILGFTDGKILVRKSESVLLSGEEFGGLYDDFSVGSNAKIFLKKQARE